MYTYMYTHASVTYCECICLQATPSDISRLGAGLGTRVRAQGPLSAGAPVGCRSAAVLESSWTWEFETNFLVDVCRWGFVGLGLRLLVSMCVRFLRFRDVLVEVSQTLVQLGFSGFVGRVWGSIFRRVQGRRLRWQMTLHVHAFTIIRHSFTPLCMRSMHTTCRWRCPCFAVVISTGSPVHPLTPSAHLHKLTYTSALQRWMDGWMDVCPSVFSESEPKQSCTQRARHLGASCPSFQAAFLGSTRRPTTVLPR